MWFWMISRVRDRRRLLKHGEEVRISLFLSWFAMANFGVLQMS